MYRSDVGIPDFDQWEVTRGGTDIFAWTPFEATLWMGLGGKGAAPQPPRSILLVEDGTIDCGAA